MESDNAPYLNQWNGRPKVNYNYVDDANSNFGSASCDSLSRIFKVANPASRHFSKLLETLLEIKIMSVVNAFIVVRDSYENFYKVEFYI